MRYLFLAAIVAVAGCVDEPEPIQPKRTAPRQFQQQSNQIQILCPGISAQPYRGSMVDKTPAEQLEIAKYGLIEVDRADVYENNGRYRWEEHMTPELIRQRYGHYQCVQDSLNGFERY